MTEHEPPSQCIPLPPDLAEVLRGQDGITALFHASNLGTVVVLAAPEVELESLGGTFPIFLAHQLYARPRGPVIRTVIGFHDRRSHLETEAIRRGVAPSPVIRAVLPGKPAGVGTQ